MTRRGFEPLYDSVKGCCVKPLHQRAKYLMADGVGFEPTRRFNTAYTISNRAPSAARTSIHMAPWEGLEPPTDRLTADCSTN